MGVTINLINLLEELDYGLVAHFLQKISAVRNRKHGDEDFQGNECRKILRSSGALLSLLPLAFQKAPLRDDGLPEVVGLKICSEAYRFMLIRRLAHLLSLFSDVVSQTMGGQLHPEWRSSLVAFGEARAEMVQLYNARIPVRGAGRAAERLTMKVGCLLTELPRRIIALGHSSVLQDSEQGFEALHSMFLQLQLRNKIPPVVEIDVSDPRQPRGGGRAARTARGRLEGRSAGVSNPSDGTRSGINHSKRKRAESLLDPQLEQPILPKIKIGSISRARAKHLQCVTQWNYACLPTKCAVQLRIEQFIMWRCICEQQQAHDVEVSVGVRVDDNN